MYKSWKLPHLRLTPLLLLASLTAQAGVISVGSVGDLGTPSTFDISLFGAVDSTFLTPRDASAPTPGGATVSVIAATPAAALAVIQQAPQGSWSGHYPAGTVILDNQFTGDVTFTFSHGIYGFGTSLDDAFGTFTGGTITAYSDIARTLSLGQFVLGSNSGLVFAGVLSTSPNIQAITIHDNSNYFAAGPLSIAESAPTPEPASALLVLLGLGAVLSSRRRAMNS